VIIKDMPPELDGGVRFVRIFPWRWTSKKGVAGNIWQNLNVSWYYNWNISENSALDLEYVPIAQKRYWPNLKQDWKARGSTELLGYNEPDHKDQANLSVDAAIGGWPGLLATGLRIGSPAVSDGGLNWLYEFMDKANAARLRVDFVAVHYYRAVGNPGNAQGAADQLYRFLKNIHDKVQRPLWVTEFNNGANWTKDPKPDYDQEKAAIAKMIEMLDKTPFVERYAIYNWVEDVRNMQRKDGSLTPAGEAYRDDASPLAYKQVQP
jgi:Glycosyl hydrolase catalytic core